MRSCIFCGASPTLENGKRASCGPCYREGRRAKRGRKPLARIGPRWKTKKCVDCGVPVGRSSKRCRPCAGVYYPGQTAEQRKERKRIVARTRAARPDVRNRERERGRQWKRRAMEILGDSCLRCGFDDPRALHIEHVADDGKAHREELGGGWASKMAQWVALHPVEAVHRVQMLCANCNAIKLTHWLERRRKAA